MEMTTPTDFAAALAQRAHDFIASIKHVPQSRWPKLVYGEMSDYRGRSHDEYCEMLMREMLEEARAHTLSSEPVTGLVEALKYAVDNSPPTPDGFHEGIVFTVQDMCKHALAAFERAKGGT